MMRIKKDKIEGSINTNKSVSKYDECIKHIQKAIDALGDAATSGDELAKESIANLSVVLLDLK